MSEPQDVAACAETHFNAEMHRRIAQRIGEIEVARIAAELKGEMAERRVGTWIEEATRLAQEVQEIGRVVDALKASAAKAADAAAAQAKRAARTRARR